MASVMIGAVSCFCSVLRIFAVAFLWLSKAWGLEIGKYVEEFLDEDYISYTVDPFLSQILQSPLLETIYYEST